MPKFKAIVTYVDLHDSDIQTEIVEVSEYNWKSACIESGLGWRETNTPWFRCKVSHNMIFAQEQLKEHGFLMKVTWID